MVTNTYLVLLLLPPLLLASVVSSFTVTRHLLSPQITLHTQRPSRARCHGTVPCSTFPKSITRPSFIGTESVGLFQSSSDNDADENLMPKRRRRRRKTTVPSTDEEDIDIDDEEVSAMPASSSRANVFVDIPVRDIREVAFGNDGATSSTPGDNLISSQDSAVSSSFRDNDDSLSSLLKDAKRLRGGIEKTSLTEEEPTLGERLSDIISAVVTIDFFVVLGLLAWFLAGVFCSYVLKDDAVQIAFNGIFQPVVQPALGVLMIASAAGAVLGKNEE